MMSHVLKGETYLLCLLFNQPQRTLAAPSPTAGKRDLENSLKFPDWFFCALLSEVFLGLI